MGCLFLFDESIPARSAGNNRERPTATVQAVDNHGTPELRCGWASVPEDGFVATFTDWGQFSRFVEAINSLHHRLSALHD